MAYKVSDYGNGVLGDVSSVTANVNSYARVTAISSNTITINVATKIGGMATFTTGAKILLHVSAVAGESKTYLGKYLLANVTGVSNNVITLDQNPMTNLLPSANLAQYYVQAIAVAQFKNLTLNTGTTITPPAFSASSYHGGIIALMCSEKLTFNGGHISLTDKGIPIASNALRPEFNQETDGLDDIQIHSGWENDCSRTFPLNCGDGAAFIITREMVCNTNSRIGNVSTFGVQFYRGATNSVTYNEAPPSNVTNVGGSSILVVAETITNFTPKMIAKYRSSAATMGTGICRCYIASETKLRNDEGLYAYDCISNINRVREAFNINNFGDGSFGNLSNVDTRINNYATITAISGTKVTYKDKTTEGLAPIGAGALVMIHFNHKGNTNVEHAGRFILAKVLSDTGSVLTLGTAPPNISTTNYAAQVISIPQCNNFTLSTKISSNSDVIMPYDGAQGGIFAIAVNNTCNLNGGQIVLSRRGGGSAYGRPGLAVIGNAQDSNKLPIGQGYGSAFILANNLIMDSNTRIGAIGGSPTPQGYCGRDHDNHGYPATYFGSGASGGVAELNGGYGGNGELPADSQETDHQQGSHILIIANKITNFNIDAINTGGGNNSSAGYGQKGRKVTFVLGGYNGGGCGNSDVDGYGGGSSGWAFVYCNDAVNQNTEGTIYED